jgi:effector-binding domain-containing protein
MTSYHCEIQSRKAQPTVCRQIVTPAADLPKVLGESYGMIMRYLGAQGVQPTGAPYVAYFNMDMQALNIEVGFPVSKPIPPYEQVESGEIPAGEYANTLHAGSYQELKAAYHALTEFVTNQNHEPTGVVYEIYLNDPSITPEDQLKTQILFMLK